MNNVIDTEGNVIHAQFGNIGSYLKGNIDFTHTRDKPILGVSVSCDLLYCDEHVAMTRLTYRVNGKAYLQHVMTEAEPRV